MSQFHLTNDGRILPCTVTVGVCRYGSGGRNHFDTLEAAEDFLAKENEIHEANKEKYASVVSEAKKSQLYWGGAKPLWWKRWRESHINADVAPGEPELLDVIQSPMGSLAVVWLDQSHEENDAYNLSKEGLGERILYYYTYSTGFKVGYLRAQYMNDETLAKAFGTDEYSAFKYQSQYGSSTYGIRPAPGREGTGIYRTGTDPQSLALKNREIWLEAIQDKGLDLNRDILDENRKPVRLSQVSEKHVPDDETVANDLALFRSQINEKIEEKKAYHKNPFVNYVSVDEPLKGLGFGASLYVYAGRQLAKKDQVLRSSSAQSKDGESIWGRMKKGLRSNYSTVEVMHNHEPMVLPALDFRKKPKAAPAGEPKRVARPFPISA